MAQQSTTHTTKKEYRRIDRKREQKSSTIEYKAIRSMKYGGRG